MQKIVKARKIHKCDMCDGNIQKGEKHIFETLREPRYDKDENQIGIEYTSFRRHNKDCLPKNFIFSTEGLKEIFKTCRKGNHDFQDEWYPGPWYNDCGEKEYTGRKRCTRCYEYKD